MPKERTYTDTGYIETQWAKAGQLVCLVSAESLPVDPGEKPEFTDAMHQFTDVEDLDRIIAGLKRARRDAFRVPAGATAPLERPTPARCSAHC